MKKSGDAESEGRLTILSPVRFRRGPPAGEHGIYMWCKVSRDSGRVESALIPEVVCSLLIFSLTHSQGGLILCYTYTVFTKQLNY